LGTFVSASPQKSSFEEPDEGEPQAAQNLVRNTGQWIAPQGWQTRRPSLDQKLPVYTAVAPSATSQSFHSRTMSKASQMSDVPPPVPPKHTVEEDMKKSTSAGAGVPVMTPFQLSLRKMEIAGAKILCKRLNEEWEDADAELRDEVEFEKRMWALIALQRLSFGQSLPNTARDVTTSNIDQEGKRILDLHGPIGKHPRVSPDDAPRCVPPQAKRTVRWLSFLTPDRLQSCSRCLDSSCKASTCEHLQRVREQCGGNPEHLHTAFQPEPVTGPQFELPPALP
jgi:hypothetical protein